MPPTPPGWGEHRGTVDNAFMPDRLGSIVVSSYNVGAGANRDWDAFGNLAPCHLSPCPSDAQ